MLDRRQKAILDDYAAGVLSVREIAEKYDVSHNYPGWLAAREGVPRRGVREWPQSPVNLNEVVLPIETGEQFRAARMALRLSARQLAHKLGVSERTLRAWEMPAGAASKRNPNKAACAVLAGMIENARSGN